MKVIVICSTKFYNEFYLERLFGTHPKYTDNIHKAMLFDTRIEALDFISRNNLESVATMEKEF